MGDPWDREHNTHTKISLHLVAISLEENHAEARKQAEDKEGNSLPVAAGVAGAESSSGTLGAGSRAALAGTTVGGGTSASGSGLGGDNASAGGAGLVHEAAAGAARRNGRNGGGVTVEVAGRGLVGAVLSLVVGVHDPAELLGGVAHAVSTVVAGGSIGSDAVALGTITETANGAEELADLLTRDTGLGSASQGVVHAGAELLVGGRRQRGGLGGPVGILSRAGGSSLGSGVRVRVDTRGVDSGDLAGVVGEVLALADRVTINGNETVVVGLLEVHVDNTTRPDRGHLVAVKGLDIGELAGCDLVAAVFGEEDGDVVVLEVLGLDVVAGLGVGRVTAPRVDVVAPEVDGIRAVTAVEVGGHLVADLTIIVGSVTNTDGAVVLVLDVCLHVTDSSLDESAGVGVVGLVGDLVTGKEAKGVVELLHLVDDSGVASVQLVVPLRVIAYDGVIGLGQIGDNVDASVGEHGHALLVVGGGVEGVDTDGVCAELLENGNVTGATSDICERVLVVTAGLVGRGAAVGGVLLLVGDTPHEATRRWCQWRSRASTLIARTILTTECRCCCRRTWSP